MKRGRKRASLWLLKDIQVEGRAAQRINFERPSRDLGAH